MNTHSIDAETLSRMFQAGAKNLEANKEIINDLNVFPVPDGDTGTNMSMTILSAARELQTANPSDMRAICKCISNGSLRGARGNSGVILSQLLRGFTKTVEDCQALDTRVLADAFEKAVETAYKAVMKPKEGTILTVARSVSDRARELADGGAEELEPFFEEILRCAEETLERTPELLPVLKQANVVDSGGKGLVEVLRGALEAYLGKEIDLTLPGAEHGGERTAIRARSNVETDIKYGYCTEFIILLKAPFNGRQEKEYRGYLESIGDSIVMVADDEICKIHVHTNDPGLAIQRSLLFGQLSNMKIDNMRMEHREKLFHMNKNGTAAVIPQEISGWAEKTQPQPVQYETAHGKSIALEGEDAPRKKMGFVSVCAGKGFSEIFRSLGVDCCIEGGQTMNPSTSDILDAVMRVNADTVFILPNNKNIILAANQVREIDMEKRVVVIPTKTIPQGVTALINFSPEESEETNEAQMKEAIGTVRSGEVTYAVRGSKIDGVKIKKGDYMGIGDDGIAAAGKELSDVTCRTLAQMVDEDTGLISVYYGADVSAGQAERLKARLEATYRGCDVELQYGGQPIYYYILSAE